MQLALKNPMNQATLLATVFSGLMLGSFTLSAHADSSNTVAGDITDIAAIRARAAATLEQHARAAGQKVQYTIEALDPRLRLRACSSPLQSGLAGDGDIHPTTSIAIRCAAPVVWTLYIRATVTATASVFVAQRGLARGTELNSTDFVVEARQVPGSAADYPSDIKMIEGQRLRQPLATGALLTQAVLELAPIVKRGQQVTLLARNSGFEIRVAAIAMSDGGRAQRIRVQNENSHQIVEAIVRNATLVEVPL
jgi:flagella basal body P-ring formation protein FlgA